ncbi:MAG: EH signature domain-containing protein, partial [Marinobacterium sp.]|nr:EH signature domain-containing protein [Marinobacterium sp.]
MAKHSEQTGLARTALAKLTLPETLTCTIRQQWPEDAFASYHNQAQQLSKLVKEAGTGSAAFDNSRSRLELLVRKNQQRQLPQALQRKVDLRAFSWLMCHGHDFRHLQLTAPLLERFYLLGQPLTRLTLLQVIELFFRRFDQLTTKGQFETLCHYLAAQSARLLQPILGLPETDNELRKLANARDILFSPSGPEQVIEHARRHQQDFNLSLNALGLGSFSSGRFQDICRYKWYLEILKACPVGKELPELAELARPEVHNAPLESGPLGLEALQILIDRSPPEQISESWQSTILTIAGDPRVPISSENYRRWWSLLGEPRINKMRGWLSRFDLALFLEVLDAYGKESGNADLQRMYPARKRFLEGLLKQELVGHTRLFLSRRADRYIRQNYRQGEVPQYAMLKESDISVIYLKVREIHLIEGTHDTKLWIYPQLPSNAQLLSYEVRQFTKAQTGSGMEDS